MRAVNCELVIIAFVVAGLLAGGAILAYEAWVAFWNWFDDRMQNSKRIANERIDRAYTTGQFHVPYGQRDFK